MALIDPIDLSQFNLVPEPTTFGPLWDQYFSDVDTLDGDLPDQSSLTAGADPSAVAAALDPPLAAVDAGITEVSSDATDQAVNQAIGASGGIDGAITASNTAINAAISGAGQLSISIPSITGITVTPPSPAPAAPPVPVLPPIGEPHGPPLAGGHVSITNVTRPGSPGRFKVGEGFSVRIVATQGATIYAISTQNGKTHGQTPFGKVPASGTITVTGSMGPGDVGSWIENWYADGNYIGQLGFTVEAS